MTRHAIEVDKRLGKQLRIVRIAKGYSQDKLAEALGCSTQQIQKYEHGKDRMAASRIWEIAHALGVDAIEIVGVMSDAQPQMDTLHQISGQLTKKERNLLLDYAQRLLATSHARKK